MQDGALHCVEGAYEDDLLTVSVRAIGSGANGSNQVRLTFHKLRFANEIQQQNSM